MSSPTQPSRASTPLVSLPKLRHSETDVDAASPALEADYENDEEESAGRDLPLSMTASVILTNLPKDASQALKEVDDIDDRKGM